jgi:uncharacterized membrane protein HdeD (DUF308 family)
MNVLEILKILMALFNIGFGLFAFFRPQIIATASSFEVHTARGRAELRIVSGGFFIGMGLGALLLGSILANHDAAYQVVGIAWLGGGASRLANLLMEDPRQITDRSFWMLLSSEVIPGAILLWPNA